MANQVTLSVERVAQVLGQLYGEETESEFKILVLNKVSSPFVTVFQGDAGDGVVSIRYSYRAEGQSLVGLLRFSENGRVVAGELYGPPEREGGVWKTINSALIAISFGTQEFKQGLDFVEQQHLASAIALYRTPSGERENKDKINERADQLITSVARFMEITRTQLDTGFFSSYDVDDIQEVMDRHLPSLNGLRGDTVDASKGRLQKSIDYLKNALATNEGFEACKREKKCKWVKDQPAPSCPSGETPYAGETLYFETMKVKSSDPFCSKPTPEKPEREPRERFGGRFY